MSDERHLNAVPEDGEQPATKKDQWACVTCGGMWDSDEQANACYDSHADDQFVTVIDAMIGPVHIQRMRRLFASGVGIDVRAMAFDLLLEDLYPEGSVERAEFSQQLRIHLGRALTEVEQGQARRALLDGVPGVAPSDLTNPAGN